MSLDKEAIRDKLIAAEQSRFINQKRNEILIEFKNEARQMDKFLDTVEYWLVDFNLADGVLYKKLRNNYLRWSDWPREFHRQNLIDYTSAWLWCEVFDRLCLTMRAKKAERMADEMKNNYLAQLGEYKSKVFEKVKERERPNKKELRRKQASVTAIT